MFTTPYRETSRSAELLEAWKSAAHDTRVAWYTWLASDISDRWGAYAGYRASVDREERAAEALAASLSPSPRRVSPFAFAFAFRAS